MTEFEKTKIESFTRKLISELCEYGYRADREGRSLLKHEGGAAFSVVSFIIIEAENLSATVDSLKEFSENFGKSENGKNICREIILLDPENLVSDENLGLFTNLMKKSGTVGDIAAVNPATGEIRKTGKKRFVQKIVRSAIENCFSGRKNVVVKRNRPEKADYSPVYILIALNVTVFLLDLIFEIAAGKRFLTDMGIQNNSLISDGQYWRLITPMFLHADIFHLLGNMFALRMIGKAVLGEYSKTSFYLFYFASGFFGNLLSYFFVDGLSLGASGAVMGLGGVMIYMIFLSNYRKFYKSTVFYLYIGFVVLYNLIYGLLPISGNVNNFGHFGGFALGFLLAVFYGALRKKKAAAEDTTA